MSSFANLQVWPTCAVVDYRPLMKCWDQTFGSTSLGHEQSLKWCEYYGFRSAVCDSPESLLRCLDIVKNLFDHNTTFADLHDDCKVAVFRFLGLSEPKNFQSGSVVRKFTLALSSFEEVLELDFSDSVLSSSLGKDVLRIFQATLGIPILDTKYPKASHLGYLTHSQRVFTKNIVTSGPVGCTIIGGVTPLDVSSLNTVAKVRGGTPGGWVLSLPHEDSSFYGMASDWLLLFVAFISGCGDAGADWPADKIVDFVRYVDCDGVEVVRCSYLTSAFLCRLDDTEMRSLLQLFAHQETAHDAPHPMTTLLMIGVSGDVSLVREEDPIDISSASNMPTRSVLATASRRGLPNRSTDASPFCRSSPEVDPATEEGWVERQAARSDYRSWDVQTLRDWLSVRVHHPIVGALKHTVLLQINAWLAGKAADGLRRLSPSEPEVPFPLIEYHNTRQFSDDVCSRVFAISTLNKLSLHVIQAELANLCPSFRCLSTDKSAYVRAVLEAFPIRAFGEAKRNSWPYLQRSRVPTYSKCTWPQGVTQSVLVALPFFDVADEGAEPLIAYYSLIQQYQGEDIVLLGVVNAMVIVPSTIFMTKGEIVAVCFASPLSSALAVDEGNPFPITPATSVGPVPSISARTGTSEVNGGGSPWSIGNSPVGGQAVGSFSAPSTLLSSFPLGTTTVFPVGGHGASFPVVPDRVSSSGVPDACWLGTRPSHAVDAAGMSGVTLVAREQPSRAKGDRTLKALMIADSFIRMVSVDPTRVLAMVMAEVFLSLVTHTGVLTQLALVEVTQILQSVNFPSYALAIPLTMSPRHDITQALTTAKLFVGWRSEEPFPESRAVRFDYRSNDPTLIYRVLWTIFRIRYGFFAFHTEIWDSLVRFASRCEKVVRDLFHWTQGAVDFMIKKALRDLEMLDDRVGLTVPSALIAPSPDAVQACPILDKFAYCAAIDLLPDMQDPIAYYTHHQLVMQAQQLHSEGVAVRYVVPLTVVPLFRVGGGGGKQAGFVHSVATPQGNTHPGSALSAQPKVARKDRSAAFLKKRRLDVVVPTGPVTLPVAPLVSNLQRLTVAKNKPCHQWLSTLGCSRGTCRFDHAAPSNKSVWNSCREELAKHGLIAGSQMGVCPVL